MSLDTKKGSRTEATGFRRLSKLKVGTPETLRRGDGRLMCRMGAARRLGEAVAEAV